MKSLLRSCFIASPLDNKDQFLRNFFALSDSGLQFEIQDDDVIWTYVKNFVQAHNHVPELATIRTHFAQRNEDTVLQRLIVLESLPAFTQGDFDVRLESKAEERRVRQVSEVLKDATVILTTGLEIRKGKSVTNLHGPIPAVHYVLDKSHEVVAPVSGSRLSGEVTGDGEDFQRNYEQVERDPLAGIGQHTGLTQIDVATNGAKKGELWVHAAFTGGLKSTWMLNWAYNQAVYNLHSSLIFSLEMPYRQCRNILYAIHSSHPKFRIIRYFLGLQGSVHDTVGLPYEDIRDGTLNAYHPNARRFMFDYVKPDFNGQLVNVDVHPDTGAPFLDPKTQEALTCSVDETGTPYPDPSEYAKIHIEIADPEKTDFTLGDIRRKAELIYSKTPFSALFIDHLGLVASRRWVPSTTDRLNEVLRDAKRLAMGFNRGRGMAVVSLFQINREGLRMALKSKEKSGTARYDLTHLSYANEAERSADMVTASWIDDDLRKSNRVQFQCLKSRDQKPFDIFLGRVEWPCRRILTCFDVPMTNTQKTTVGDSVDKAVDALINQ